MKSEEQWSSQNTNKGSGSTRFIISYNKLWSIMRILFPNVEHYPRLHHLDNHMSRGFSQKKKKMRSIPFSSSAHYPRTYHLVPFVLLELIIHLTIMRSKFCIYFNFQLKGQIISRNNLTTHKIVTVTSNYNFYLRIITTVDVFLQAILKTIKSSQGRVNEIYSYISK